MINISQIENFTESGAAAGVHPPGKAGGPEGFSGKTGKNYLPRGNPGGVHIYGILW